MSEKNMIVLKRHADRRIRKGHLWVFSNEIATPRISELETGSIHELQDAAGEFIGMVYANPSSLIAARILSRKKAPIDRAFFVHQIEAAVERRKRLFPDRDTYRVVFGEGDLLPGLVVDKYGPVLAIQSLTAGIDAHMDLVQDALVEILAPEAIYLRNDSPFRMLEGLPLEKRLAYGKLPEQVIVELEGLKFVVDVPGGQKTGMYLDQESNRSLLKHYVWPGASVLDLFCYTGGWGIHAVAAGATEVTAVDSSRPALNTAQANADLNGFGDRFDPIKDNALDFLKKTSQTWDVIVLDPPAFIKSRSLVKEGLKGYIDINRRALGKLQSGGILVTCSCSHHLDPPGFESALLSASRQSGRELRLLDARGQAPDHPVLLAMPETRYLKVMVAQVV
ncbi:MAG: class I SAM-dependent rRNA methyltransferase [Desulfomonile tiedjei]|nr:class I SAM-dependent rRNA methyltransferase [Desulfomonile tiedjei]